MDIVRNEGFTYKDLITVFLMNTSNAVCVDIHIRLCWTQKSVNRCAVDHKHLNTVADESYRRDQQLHLPAGVAE